MMCQASPLTNQELTCSFASCLGDAELAKVVWYHEFRFNFAEKKRGENTQRGSNPLNVGCRWFVSESPAAFVTHTVKQ